MNAHRRRAAAAAMAALMLGGSAAGASPTRGGGASAPTPAPSAARAAAGPRPTAQELYVGCYLLIRDTDVPLGVDHRKAAYSAANCGEQILSTMIYREGATGQPYRFCLPNEPAIQAEPAQQMAKAYLDYYEKKFARIPKGADGSTAFIVAMVDKWPCPSRAPARP